MFHDRALASGGRGSEHITGTRGVFQVLQSPHVLILSDAYSKHRGCI